MRLQRADAALTQRQLRLLATCKAAASASIGALRKFGRRSKFSRCRPILPHIQMPPGTAAEEEQLGLRHLLQQSGTQGHFEVKQSRHGQGIFATREFAKGQVSAP